MFTACTHTDVKSIAVKLLQSPDSCLRVFIATIAFGSMGLDYLTLEKSFTGERLLYMQESGRAG